MTTAEVGWLCWGGTEIVHDARVLSYLARGLAGAHMQTSVGYDTAGVVSGLRERPYTDEYFDTYFEAFTVDCSDGFAPPCLRCICRPLVVGETFTSPAADDAPWYQASVARSGDFLGVLATDMTLLPAHARAQKPRTRFGGTRGPQQLLPRVLQVTGQMYAATAGGMEWGQRWLTDVLTGACDDGADAQFLPFCPADQADLDATVRALADCVVIDGPFFSDAGLFADFRVNQVRFQVSSSAPWLLGLPVVCQNVTLAPGASASCLIETGDWGGGQALRLTASGDLNGLNVRAVPLAADQACPVVGEGMAAAEFTVARAQPGDVLTVDASRRSALLFDVTSKRDVSAIPYLDFVGPMPWVEAPPCTRLCVTVHNTGTGTADVALETVVTEL